MISVTILTCNSEARIRDVLESVKYFDDVVILDSGSKDNTMTIAQEFPNVTVYTAKFEGFGPKHNRASSLAKYDWILSVDSDEVLSGALAKEILLLPLDPQNVYSFPMHNYFNGKHIKGCGWYPDRHVRLYNRTSTRFTDVQVHEGIITKDLKEVLLRNNAFHYSYNTIFDFLKKMQWYSDLFATQNKDKKKSSVCKAAFHGVFAFIKSYILQRGFLCGAEGFIISVYNGNTAFYKYLKLWEANRTLYKKE